jgi:hypothetical protein
MSNQLNQTPSTLLEKIVLHNSTRPVKNLPKLNGQKRSSVNNNTRSNQFPILESENKQGKNYWNTPFCWATAPSGSLAVEFCQETSIQ